MMKKTGGLNSFYLEPLEEHPVGPDEDDPVQGAPLQHCTKHWNIMIRKIVAGTASTCVLSCLIISPDESHGT